MTSAPIMMDPAKNIATTHKQTINMILGFTGCCFGNARGSAMNARRAAFCAGDCSYPCRAAGAITWAEASHGRGIRRAGG
jgi:hypothetical protein